tara:strand:- start:393 stop:599 length:207 start_codon:yes stop_codon:yes gene_type:complete
MITNIKNLYEQVNDKKGLILLLSEEFNVRPNSIRTNWFSTYWSIPLKHEQRVLSLLQNTVTQQNSVTI